MAYFTEKIREYLNNDFKDYSSLEDDRISRSENNPLFKHVNYQITRILLSNDILLEQYYLFILKYDNNYKARPSQNILPRGGHQLFTTDYKNYPEFKQDFFDKAQKNEFLIFLGETAVQSAFRNKKTSYADQFWSILVFQMLIPSELDIQKVWEIGEGIEDWPVASTKDLPGIPQLIKQFNDRNLSHPGIRQKPEDSTKTSIKSNDRSSKWPNFKEQGSAIVNYITTTQPLNFILIVFVTSSILWLLFYKQKLKELPRHMSGYIYTEVRYDKNLIYQSPYQNLPRGKVVKTTIPVKLFADNLGTKGIGIIPKQTEIEISESMKVNSFIDDLAVQKQLTPIKVYLDSSILFEEPIRSNDLNLNDTLLGNHIHSHKSEFEAKTYNWFVDTPDSSYYLVVNKNDTFQPAYQERKHLFNNRFPSATLLKRGGVYFSAVSNSKRVNDLLESHMFFDVNGYFDEVFIVNNVKAPKTLLTKKSIYDFGYVDYLDGPLEVVAYKNPEAEIVNFLESKRDPKRKMSNIEGRYYDVLLDEIRNRNNQKRAYGKNLKKGEAFLFYHFSGKDFDENGKLLLGIELFISADNNCAWDSNDTDSLMNKDIDIKVGVENAVQTLLATEPNFYNDEYIIAVGLASSDGNSDSSIWLSNYRMRKVLDILSEYKANDYWGVGAKKIVGLDLGQLKKRRVGDRFFDERRFMMMTISYMDESRIKSDFELRKSIAKILLDYSNDDNGYLFEHYSNYPREKMLIMR